MALVATVRGNPVAWDDFYKTARWRRLRKFQLMQHPLCKFCLQRGIVTRANVVDHVAPPNGDWTDFIIGDLQSLCEPCHNSAKRQVELRGYRCDVGIDGYPIDPNHPFNRAGTWLAEGNPIHASAVTVLDNGQPNFQDGRHRFAVLRDYGLNWNRVRAVTKLAARGIRVRMI